MLFNRLPFNETFPHRTVQAIQAINDTHISEFTNAEQDDKEIQFYTNWIFDIPVLDIAKMEMSKIEEVAVPYKTEYPNYSYPANHQHTRNMRRVIFKIPFKGDDNIFQFSGNIFSLCNASGEIKNVSMNHKYIVFNAEIQQHEEIEQIQVLYKEWINKVQSILSEMQKQAESFYPTLRAQIASAVKRKIEKANQLQNDETRLANLMGK